MKEKNYTIEFWRFLGCIGIILLHFEGAVVGNDTPLRWFRSDYLWVDFYFMLSGFFLYLSFRRGTTGDPLTAAARYTWHRIKRFAPAYYSSFAFLFLYQNYRLLAGGQIKQVFSNLYKSFWELLFLHSTGLTWDFVNFVTWYVSALVLVGFFAYALLVWNEKVFLGIIAPFFVLLIYPFYSGGIDVHLHYARISWGAANRAVAGICLGCLVAYFYLAVREKNITKRQVRLFSALELAIVLVAAWELIGKPLDGRNMRMMVLFPALIFFSAWQKTWLSRLLNRPLCGFLGKLSVGMYFYQTLVRDLWLRAHPVAAQAPIPLKEYAVYLVYVMAAGLLLYGAGTVCRRLAGRCRPRSGEKA